MNDAISMQDRISSIANVMSMSQVQHVMSQVQGC